MILSSVYTVKVEMKVIQKSICKCGDTLLFSIPNHSFIQEFHLTFSVPNF